MRAAFILVAALFALEAFGLDVSNRYRSPRNPERNVRKSTELIVLHTTEAPAKSSLNKLCDRGEAHYCVTEEGFVYRIVDRDRVAFHAGRSMWRGKEDVDHFSIGIEVVGHHDKAMGSVQLRALRELVKRLQKMYRISDDCVVCHSHVAYGAPNKWHKTKHRGRKRCGMLFAMPSVRAQLGLSRRPTSDADVRARRLVVGDAYLERVLYGNKDTMRGVYASATPVKKDGPGVFGWLRPAAPKNTAPKTPSATQTAAKSPTSAKKTPTAANASTPAKTAASATPAKAATGPAPKSIAELKAQGYVQKGVIAKGTTVNKIAGSRWNAADTYYTIRNKVLSGSSINPARVECGTAVWMKP